MIHGAVAWLSDPKHPNYEAAARAIEKVYGALPDYTREGGSIPITSCIEEATGMNVLLLPIGACDDMAHSQNEKYNISNLVNGIKVMTNETRSDRRKPPVNSLIGCSILLSLGFGSLLA